MSEDERDVLFKNMYAVLQVLLREWCKRHCLVDGHGILADISVAL